MNRQVMAIEPSATLAISSRARKMAAEGISVCNFSAGEPDFDTPEPIKQAAVAALAAGETKYTPANGLPSLCKAIAEKLARDNGIAYKPDQVIVSCGAKHSLALAFQTLLNPGDEVLIPAPYWLSYPEMVRVAGGVPRFVDGKAEAGFKITPAQLDAACTDKTVAVVINSPCNPSGLAYDGEELRALGEVAVRRKLWVVADEIYEKMIYGGTRHVSMAALSPALYARTITINGFSKSYAMTGWRLGYTAGPAEFVKAMGAVQSHCASAPNTFAQFGAVVALQRCEADIVRMVAAFAERRETLHARLVAIPGVRCVKPAGAFYMLPDVSAFGLGSMAFAQRMLEEGRVAVVPGVAFGNDACVRFSYACSMAEIAEGMDRFTACCAKLR